MQLLWLTGVLWCRFCKFSTVGKAVPGVRVRVEGEEANSYGDLVGELHGYGRNICMGYLNKVRLLQYSSTTRPDRN
jgi:hypothetical protein